MDKFSIGMSVWFYGEEQTIISGEIVGIYNDVVDVKTEDAVYRVVVDELFKSIEEAKKYAEQSE